MCLAIPKKVISVKNGSATIKSSKGTQTVGLLIGAQKGDWVLTQNNIAVRKISARQAKEIKSLLQNTN
ncbi:MAG: HypC/HybG/HupF family hydrogenase formation chaperone [Candidatus Portnoybacteria bacterium]|nr:HypC/HybG/HupF family hydrogenase formation chaperone [Candidatus Portnoybacteria bacterium]